MAILTDDRPPLPRQACFPVASQADFWEAPLQGRDWNIVIIGAEPVLVVFLSLKHPLEQGGRVKATLKFDHAGTIDVEFPVLAIGAAAPGSSAAGGSTMQDLQGGSKVAARCRWTSADAQLPTDPIPAYAGSRNPGLMPSGSGMRNVLRIIETSA
jgi:hypothetical protein